MNQRAEPRTDATQAGRPRWQVAIFQLLFGAMAVTLGGFISAEPTLSLDRRDDGRLECRYALNAYGRIPAMTASVDDLVRYSVTEGRVSGTRGTSSSSASVATRYHLRLTGRDGSSFAVGQTWSLAGLDRMIDGSSDDRSHRERIAAGSGRKYGGLALGAFGLLLLAGAIWNLFLMITGLGSARAAIDPG